MFYWFTLSLAGIAIAILIVIARRRWKELRLLDPHSITEERERVKREELLEQRFERLKIDHLLFGKRVFEGIRNRIKTLYRIAEAKLSQLERMYAQAKAPLSAFAPSSKERMRRLLDEANALARESKWAEAERRLLEALSIDSRNVSAFKGLGAIYLKQKLYPQARETYEFLVKKKKADDACYAALAEIAEAEGDSRRVEEMRKKAIEAQPRLALRHAELAAFYLARGEGELARIPAEKCVELGPTSPRCLEISVEAAILYGDHSEAKRRYDALRLLSEDQQKLQTLKERIDAMSS